jgi:hypothetical protein
MRSHISEEMYFMSRLPVRMLKRWPKKMLTGDEKEKQREDRVEDRK